jgi:hypothetical protein
MATFNFGNFPFSQYILATGKITYLMPSAMQCVCIRARMCVCGGGGDMRNRQIKGKRRLNCFNIFIFKVTECVEETQRRNGKKRLKQP